MATRFEIVLHGGNAPALRAAGEEALAEIDRIEGQLSLFLPGSDIARVNAAAALHPVRVSPQVFQLLQQARSLHAESGGAFDITVAPLVRCWGFMDGSGGRLPAPDELSAAQACVGMRHVTLRPEDFTVAFDRPGVMLDLGAIGKGYAIERAAILLREAGITSALIHGGTSSIYAIGKPPSGGPWKIAIECPPGKSAESAAVAAQTTNDVHAGQSAESVNYKFAPAQRRQLRAIVALEDESLSVSAVWGKFFASDDAQFGHVLDPRADKPVSNAVLAAIALPSATETDALSTALLVTGPAGHTEISQLRQSMRSLVIAPSRDGWSVAARGIETL